jgi:hypothetical protein
VRVTGARSVTLAMFGDGLWIRFAAGAEAVGPMIAPVVEPQGKRWRTAESP